MPSTEAINLIWKMFEDVFEVSINATFMIIRCRSLPPRPWPLTMGGIPLWLSDSPTETHMASGTAGRSPPILPELNLSKICCPAGEGFELIVEYFSGKLGFQISEIMWSGPQLRIKTSDNAQLTALPFKTGGLLTLYDYSSAIPETAEAVNQLISPPATIRDDTCHTPNLHPGVVLSSGGKPSEELLTCSGIIIEGRNGERWLTIATQGFPPRKEEIYHPTSKHAPIGTVEKTFAETDISLAELHSGIHYASRTSSSE
ncbi:hypothetical protein MMC16_004256 [Acarospora aff. strigata]|nr:hypothetical protein [Acarospora aff. strigata]